MGGGGGREGDLCPLNKARVFLPQSKLIESKNEYTVSCGTITVKIVFYTKWDTNSQR